MVFRSTNTHQMHPNHKLQLCRMSRTSSNPKESLPKESPRIWCHKSMIQEVWEVLTARSSDCKLASIVQSSLRFLFTLGLIFFSKCSFSAQQSWPCCFLFFPSSSLPNARSILLPTVRFLSSPGSSWRGWGLSLLLLLLQLLLTESLAVPLFPPLLQSAFAAGSESSLGVESDLRDLRAKNIPSDTTRSHK